MEAKANIEKVNEGILALQEVMSTVKTSQSDLSSKQKSFEEKYESLTAENKSAFDKISADLKKSDAEAQKLSLKFVAIENEKKEAEDRIKNIENQVVMASKENTGNYKESNEYKAFNDLIVKYGKDKNFHISQLSADEAKYLRTDVGTEGGYTVPTVLDNQFLKEAVEISPVVGMVRRRNLPGVKTLDIPIRSDISTAYWAGEHEAIEKSNSKYKLASLTAHALGVQTETTRDLINTSGIDIVGELTVDAQEAFGKEMGRAILLGTSVKQPQGILDNSSGVERVDSAASGLITLDDVINLSSNLKTSYSNSSITYGFNRRVLNQLRTEQTNDGQYLWRVGGETMPAKISDIPYVILPDMPGVAVDNTPVIVGDFFRGYTLLDAMGMELVRDDVTKASQRSIIFNWFRFLDGRTTIPEAFKLLKVKA